MRKNKLDVALDSRLSLLARRLSADGAQHPSEVLRLERVVGDIVRLRHGLLTLTDQRLEFRPLDLLLAQFALMAFIDAARLFFSRLFYFVFTIVPLLSHFIDELECI